MKVGSDDFVNIPLIRRYATENVPLLLSCGMATEEEIDLTLKNAGVYTNKELCLFLCTSEYPTPPEDVNIRKLLTLREKYPELVLGLSDHTVGSTAAVMAVAYGAGIFEKHFTLDHNLPGPDHWFSEEPEALKKWVSDVRTAYQMLGTLIYSLRKRKCRYEMNITVQLQLPVTLHRGMFLQSRICVCAVRGMDFREACGMR